MRGGDLEVDPRFVALYDRPLPAATPRARTARQPKPCEARVADAKPIVVNADQVALARAMAIEKKRVDATRAARFMRWVKRTSERAIESTWRWYLMIGDALADHAGGFVVAGNEYRRRGEACRGCTFNKTVLGHEFCEGCPCPKKWYWPFARLTWKRRLGAFRCPIGKF